MKDKNWASKYLQPPVDAKGFKEIHPFRSLKDSIILLFHSIRPHKVPELNEKLPQIPVNTDNVYNSSTKMYDESQERIKDVESKSFNLLSYITALTTVAIFLLSEFKSTTGLILLSISSVLLFISLFLSFRGLSIKNIKTVFINTLYAFERDDKSKKSIEDSLTREYLIASIYNNNVADNQVDILKSTRFLLSFSMILIITSLTFELIKGNSFFVKNEDLIESKLDENFNKINEGITDFRLKIEELNNTFGQNSTKQEVIVNDLKDLKDQLELFQVRFDEIEELIISEESTVKSEGGN